LKIGDGELSLANVVAEQVEAYVYAFGPFLLDGVVAKADGEFVVTQERCGWLYVSECRGNSA
jgi:hypothetical protein